jgi:tRNA (adenine37-N6)-methyltransferase
VTGRTFELREIATVRSPRTDGGDHEWGSVEAEIRLVDRYDARALRGLEQFSHVEVIFVFDRVFDDEDVAISRHPRANPRWPEVGIFAQRNRDRPNHIGLTTCEILAVEGTTVRVRGLDAVDGTPVIDLKPHFSEYAPRSAVRQPAWSRELMTGYF